MNLLSFTLTHFHINKTRKNIEASVFLSDLILSLTLVYSSQLCFLKFKNSNLLIFSAFGVLYFSQNYSFLSYYIKKSIYIFNLILFFSYK